MRLDGKIALVTGGGSGIGKDISLRFAGVGSSVAVMDIDEETARATVDEIRKHFPEVEAVAIRCDVSIAEDVRKAVAAARDAFGCVNILVNNAGVTRDNLMMRMSEQEWKEVIDTNLNGAFNCTRAVVFPMMKQKGGSVVNITSVSGIIGMMGQTNYASSKAGLIGFTKSLAKELARFNISVNAVAPGFIDTEMTQGLKKEYMEEALKLIPMGRVGKAEEVAKAVAFLVSDASSYTTGHVLNVDGGLAM